MRGTVVAIAAAVALLATAAIGAWLARVHLAQVWLDRTLAAEGYPDARFDVTAVGLQRVVVEDLALHGGRGVRVERLEASYALPSVLIGSLASVELRAQGLRARLDPWGTRPAAERPGATDARRPAWLDTLRRLAGVRVEAARVRLDSPFGAWRLRGEVALRAAPGGLAGRIDGAGRNERLGVEGEVDADLAGDRVEASLSLRDDDGFELEASAVAEAPWPDARVRLEVESRVPGGADFPWAVLPGPRPSTGTLRVDASASGRMGLAASPRAWPALVARVAEGEWSGRWRVQGRDIAVPHRVSGVDVAARGRAFARDGALIVRAERPPRLRVAGVQSGLLERLRVPAFARAHARGPLEVDWLGDPLVRVAAKGQDDAGFRFQASPRWRVSWPERAGSLRIAGEVTATVTADGGMRAGALERVRVTARDWRAPGTQLERAELRGHVDGVPRAPSGSFRLTLEAERLPWAGARLQGVAATVPLRVTETAGRPPRIEPRGDIQATVRRWRAGERVRGSTELRVRVPHLRAALRPPYRWGAAIAVEPFEVTTKLGGKSERVAVVPGPLRAGGAGTDGALVALATRARLLERDVRLRSIEARLEPGGPSPWARFAVGRVTHGARPARFAPVALSGRIERNAGGYTVAADGRWLEADAAFRLEGDIAPAAGAAAFDVEVPPVRFDPDGPQPGDLIPRLGGWVEAVRGRASAQMQWRLRPEALQGEARVELEGVGFARAGVRVRGLDAGIRFDRLSPLRTAGEQRLRIERIETAVPLTDARVRWVGGRGAAGFRVRIASAEARVLGGRARLRETTLDPQAQVHNLGVRLDGIELERLLARLEIDGLTGRGRLSGRVPITMGEPGLAVRDARLRGTDGRVALNSTGADAALRGGGRDARLMLAALRDFAYDALEVGIDAPLSGPGTIGIRLEGHNPGVLSGRRFTFDVALEGEVTPLLDAMARGEPLSDARIARHLDLRERP